MKDKYKKIKEEVDELCCEIEEMYEEGFSGLFYEVQDFPGEDSYSMEHWVADIHDALGDVMGKMRKFQEMIDERA